SVEDIAARRSLSIEAVRHVIETGREQLFEIREKRIKPARDEKILTAWNGLMLSSFAEGSAILQRENYRKVAEKNAEFLLVNLEKDGLLLRTFKDGEAKLNGYQEDYACLIDGMISL